MIFDATALPLQLREQSERYHLVYQETLRTLRRQTQDRFEEEVQRMGEQFLNGPLARHSEPMLSAIVNYVGWLGWSFWCASYLAPPLHLLRGEDIRRYAAAMIAYSGPRLMDDALDIHLDYKGKQSSTLGTLVKALPNVSLDDLRCQTMLAGQWICFYGLERLSRHGGNAAAARTRRLYEHIIPTVIVEGIAQSELSFEQYEQLVNYKSVRYDQILYVNLVGPITDSKKTNILKATSKMSQIAQYLNDIGDSKEDAENGQPNFTRWFPDSESARSHFDESVRHFMLILDELPNDVADALAAAMVETFDAAGRLNTQDIVKELQ